MHHRVRFAPSPTGPLHIGGVRTLLYNYLFARKTGGNFILRIEDTDQKRFFPSAEQYILETMQWLGLEPDEGPLQGGPHGPYRQSQRLGVYTQYIQALLEAGHAYYAFDTPEALAAMRLRLKTAKVPAPQYNAITRTSMQNSLTLPTTQVAAWMAEGKPYVIRLKVPPKAWIRFYDGIHGWIKVESATLDDKVLIKADGLPTYHFASVVDDHLMDITHVIRGEEWLPSTPIHILLYRYLGWEDALPQFLHLPLLLAPQGGGKLSKRHADQYHIPVFPIAWQAADFSLAKGFREAGYLGEALCNFLALLGWNPGTGQEFFTRESLIKAFSLERLGKSSVQFDLAKANWFNQQHIAKQAPTVWARYFLDDAAKEGVHASPEEAMAICRLVKDRITFPGDFWREGKCLLLDPLTYDDPKWNPPTQAACLAFNQGLPNLSSWEQATIKPWLQATTGHLPTATIFPPLRMALTGGKAGPDLISIMLQLGKERTHHRITVFLAQMEK